MAETNFDRLLERYLRGEVTEQERIKIEAWLDVKKTEGEEDVALGKDEEEELFQRIMGRAEGTRVPGRGAGYMTRRVIGIAASVLIIVGVSYLAWYLYAPGARDSSLASQGGIEKLILNDGSLVWLKGKSTLTYYEKPVGGSRHAAFAGEALFEVAKDPGRPFLITCGDVTIKVLGTSFSLRAGTDNVELQVLTGRVHLSSLADVAGLNVESNQKVIYSAKGLVQKNVLSANEISAVTSNTEYDMKFNNTGMKTVVEQISRKFDVAVSFTDAQAEKCRITADFTDHSLESTLEMISEVLDVECTRQGRKVIISGTGCP